MVINMHKFSVRQIFVPRQDKLERLRTNYIFSSGEGFYGNLEIKSLIPKGRYHREEYGVVFFNGTEEESAEFDEKHILDWWEEKEEKVESSPINRLLLVDGD